MNVRTLLPVTTDAGRDARTVRRALRAGLVVWGGLSALLLSLVVVSGADGRTGLWVVLVAVVAGGLVASAWLLAAAFLDLLAGETPGRRRALWTVGVVAFTFVSPILALGAAG